MFVRSALMISAPVYDAETTQKLVASPDEFSRLRELFQDTRIGKFGTITPLPETDFQTAKNEIERFFENREFHELLLFYITGYELVNIEGEIFFVDKDTDPQNVEETSVPARFIYDLVKDCKAEKKFIIIDCFSREEVDQERKSFREKRLADFSNATNSVVILSLDTVGTTFTDSGTKNPGFTESLILGLETGDADLDGRGYITEDELFIFVYKHMNKHGVAPNLFISSLEGDDRLRIAQNVQFASMPEYAKEDSAINLSRFFKLVGSRKQMKSEKERESLRNVIRAQPEITALKRISRALLVAALAGLLVSLLFDIAIGRAIGISLFVIFVVVLDGILSQVFS